MLNTQQKGLKNAVEAASKGKQTVLFTSNGQPTYVNIIKKNEVNSSDDSKLFALGYTGIHPAFKVGAVELDKIYVSTYPVQLVNGELLSLPYKAATGIRNISSNTFGFPEYLKKTGLNSHICTVTELNLLKALANKSKYNPYGNDLSKGRSEVDISQFGIRADGKEPGADNTVTLNSIGAQNSGAILTGSGPCSFRGGNSPTGICDLGSGYSSPVFGVRIIKGEVQVYGNPLLKNYADASPDLNALTVIGNSGSNLFLENWYAIDATSGNLINPTFTGSLNISESNNDLGNYVVTTANSVKLTTAISPNIPAGFYSIAQLQTDGSLPEKVVNILRYFGLITDNIIIGPNAANRGSFGINTNGINFASWGGRGIFETRIDSIVWNSNPRIFYYD